MTIATHVEPDETDEALIDGTSVHVRPIRSTDGALLAAFDAGLSHDTRYFRFFSPRPNLRPEEIEHFVTVDHVDREAFVAILGGRIVGVARFDRLADHDGAEVAFVVADELQGHGVATLLLHHLAMAGRHAGITRFTADVLPTNRRMLDFFRDCGFERLQHCFCDGVIHIELSLDELTLTNSASRGRPTVRPKPDGP